MTATRARSAGSLPARAGYQDERIDDFDSFLRPGPIWSERIERSEVSTPFAGADARMALHVLRPRRLPLENSNHQGFGAARVGFMARLVLALGALLDRRTLRERAA